ncbi:MAG: nucleoside triphosphate pyrophosphohydrolase, partial [Spirochaetales bacterium]|nr:nucleoside triphosphate pyrophosphohydrolase [Spirochaetales bacterium]
SLRRYLIEESFEALAALNELDDAPTQREAYSDVTEELGDVVLITLLLADALETESGVSFTDILLENGRKLVRRHPHVFDSVRVKDEDEVVANWHRIKQDQEGKTPSIVASGGGLPPLERAYETQRKAAKVGFDWPEVDSVFLQITEEIEELREALRITAESEEPLKDNPKIEEELGDILFSVVNLSRHLKSDPSLALERTNRKFLTRFRYIEDVVRSRNKTLQEMTLVELDTLWNEAKDAAYRDSHRESTQLSRDA